MLPFLLFFIITSFSFFIVMHHLNSSKNHNVDRYTSASPRVTPNQVYSSFSNGPPHPILGIDCASADCVSPPCSPWESCPYNNNIYTGPPYPYPYYDGKYRRYNEGGHGAHGGGAHEGHGGGHGAHGGGGHR